MPANSERVRPVSRICWPRNPAVRGAASAINSRPASAVRPDCRPMKFSICDCWPCSSREESFHPGSVAGEDAAAPEASFGRVSRMFCVFVVFTRLNTWVTKVGSPAWFAKPASKAATLVPIPVCTADGDAPSLSAKELVTCHGSRFMIESTIDIFTTLLFLSSLV
jgi:hypothetical protein